MIRQYESARPAGKTGPAEREKYLRKLGLIDLQRMAGMKGDRESLVAAIMASEER